MKRSTPGCQHSPENMAKWLHEGACPLCLSMHVSMLRAALRDTEQAMDNLLLKLESGQIEPGAIREMRVNVTTALRLIPETKPDE